jgi:hypothetical protein
MTVEQLRAVPSRKWNEDVPGIRAIVILPGGGDESDLHNSGYRCMDFVAANHEDEPICRLSGCSDVVHIEGIGGFGKDWLKRHGTVPRSVTPRDWSIDCLPTSGCLRLFTHGHITVGPALSSFEVYSDLYSDKKGK